MGAIHRDLDKLEKWVHGFMRFNKIKCKVLHLDRGKHQYQYRLGDEQTESSPAERHLGMLVDEAGHELAMCTHSLESQPCSGDSVGSVGSRLKGGNSALLFYSHETPPGIMHPALGSPTWGHRTVAGSPEEATKMI
ncbi:rna-directed dna polymerase from mobile element jockey-like [Pitangus sulphuratus]|nr:rna-directed dna polymerase from mobile element jockey-like [Pitangus sulphuratus]